MARIYTKVGDKGQTSLVGGQKVSKDDLRIEAYGTIDELNSVLGSARVAVGESSKKASNLAELDQDLETIQHWLFDLGSLLATIAEDREKFKLPQITQEQIQWLEARIDSATAELKPLKNFILPAGSEASARLHVARTVARRAERCMVMMGAELPENSLPFINRLSDYFFTMARYCNHALKIEDVIWKRIQV